MDILANYGTVLILIAAAFGFLMAIGIGANDVAERNGHFSRLKSSNR